MGNNQYLDQIQDATLNLSQVGSVAGETFNFNALARDPQGNLWLVTDYGGNSLWEINKQTGVGTLKTQIELPGNNQATALAITGTGQFVIYSTTPVTNSISAAEYFYLLNPTSGSTTQVSQAFTNTPTVFADITAMAFDPANNGIYGIQENVLASPKTYDLVQITGVPEPGSVLSLGGIAVIGLTRRERRRLHT
jgi:preprotein translocase subunit SecA